MRDLTTGIDTGPKGFPIEAARWLVLGLAMANRSFADRLTFEVGPWAFKGGELSQVLYNAVEAGPPYDVVMKAVFGVTLKEGEKPWDALLRELGAVATAAQHEKDFKPLVRLVANGDYKGALEIVKDIAAKTDGGE